MITPPWYVLTGGPCSGKTTLLLEFEKRGFHTSPEAARLLIEEKQKKGISVEELRKKDDLQFQKDVVNKKLELESKTPINKVVFFDRGITDCIAYYQMLDVFEVKELENISKNRYKKIFFLEPLPFKKDDARIEDEEAALKISRLILEAYKKVGYDVVMVPPVSVKERVDLILSHLE